MRVSTPGFLVAIEGIDGAGKSTQAQLLHEALRARQLQVVRSREPTNGVWGQLLRESATTGRLSAAEEVDTFMRDRQEHVQMLILPALSSGVVVILDRYYFSNAAYQGARGLDPETILRRNEEFAPEPDLLILIEVNPEIGLGRVKSRGDRADLFENNAALARAQEIFAGMQRPYLCRIDGRQTLEEIQGAILEAFSRALAGKLSVAPPQHRSQLSETWRRFSQRP